MATLRAGTQYRFVQRIDFDQHRYGSDSGIPDGEYQIIRGSDSQFWNGSGWQASEVWNATTVAGGTTDPRHFFDWTVPSSPADGEVFNIRIRANSDPATESLLVASEAVEATTGGGGGGAVKLFTVVVDD